MAAFQEQRPSLPTLTSSDASLIRDLCDLEIAGDIQFSPKGERLVYCTSLSWGSQKGHHGVSTIWLATTDQTLSSRPLTSGAFRHVNPRWHPAGQKIAFISDRAEASMKWAIYTQTVDQPDTLKAVTPVENEQAISTFEFSPDGKSIAYLSADEKTAEQKERERNREDVQVWDQDWPYARLRTVDAQTAQIRTLALERHITNLCWSCTGAEIAIVSCKTTDTEAPYLSGSTISIVSQDLTTTRHLCDFPNAIQDLVWANDDKLYFWSGVPAETNYAGSGVYTIDLNATQPSYKHMAFAVDSDAFALVKVDGGVVAKVQHRLEDRIVHISGEVLYSKKQEIQAFNVSPPVGGEGPRLAVATSDVNHPVEVYVITNGGNSVLQLSNHGKNFDKRAFGVCHYLSCMSTDQAVELDGLYLEPDSHVAAMGSVTGRKPFSTVVLIHGGPTTRLTNAFNTYYYMLSPYLLSLGFGVLIPNYRGSSGRGQKFASYSNGGVGIHDYADIIAMSQFAIDQGLADPERMIVGGWSQGGLLTNLCCVRNGLHGGGWRFNAAISGASICDIDTMALTSDMGSTYQPELHNGSVIWNGSSSDTRCRDASALWAFKSVMDRVKNEGKSIIPPMLILHGAEDKRCPVSQAWGLRRALESYSLPFKLVIYPRQGHIFHEQNFWVDMALRIGQWCRMYMNE